MRQLLSVLMAVLAAALLPAAARAADPPAVTTGTPTDVTDTQATLVATVDPKGSATTVHFELGTTTAYGLQSADKDTGSGSGPVSVAIPVQSLSPSTTYHVRAVAVSAAGTTRGADVSFRTGDAAARPSVSTGGARGVTATAATLTATVNPRGAATSYRFEWGKTSALGQVAGAGDAGAGTSAVAVSASLAGLEPHTRYAFRIVAVNRLGTSRGAIHSFTTAGTPTAATLKADRVRVPYGAPLVLTGRLSGSKTSGVRVRLLTRTFPFASPFADTGKPVATSSKGTYKFTIASLTQSIRALVIADGAPPVISHAVDVFSVARVSVLSVKGRGRRVHIAGRVTPAPAAARASLQRLASNGRWVPVRRARLRAGGRYGFTVHRRSRTLRLRIAGMANDGGAHARGLSRELVLRPVS